MKIALPFNGGINKDANPLLIDSENGEVLSRKNCRVLSTDGGRGGINVSIKGMTEIEASLPSGTNQTVGAVEDVERDQIVFANYNSSGNHGIYVLKNDVVKELSAGSFWGFKTEYPVDMDILGDYVRLTDNYNPPRKLNVVTPSIFTLDADGVQVAMKHSTSAPTVAVGSDSSKRVNKLIGKAFQFATYLVYQDDSYSVLSPYSEIAVSSSVFSEDSGTYVDNAVGNYINVTYGTGSDDVKTVVLLAREGNTGSWFIVDEHDRESSADRTVTFFNDVAREFLSVKKSLALYSDVPLLAKSNVAVKNRIGYGGVTKGYNKTDLNLALEVEYETVNVSGSSVTIPTSKSNIGDTHIVSFTIPNTLSEGDVINVDIDGFYLASDVAIGDTWDFTWEYKASYVVQAGDTEDDVANYFSADISSNGKDIITAIGAGDLIDMQVLGGSVVGGETQIRFVGVYDSSYTVTAGVGGSVSLDTPPQGVATYKAGSYYNVGALWYDERSRTSGVLGSQRVYIPSNGERDYADVGKRARIKFTMQSSIDIPSWATHLRFAATESINFAGVYPFVTGNDIETNIYDGVYIDGKKCIAINMPTNLKYEFVNGDYLQIETDSGTAITTTNKVIIGTRSLIEKSGTEHSGFWLIIPQGTNSASDFNGIQSVIYRPKSEVSELIYYEDYNTYAVSEIEGLTGYVGDGDAWFTQRTFEWDSMTTTEIVEDFYIDPDSALRAYSKGRAVVEFDTRGRIFLQDFVWSEPYLDNTTINGTSFYDPLNRVQLDEKDGIIQRVLLVGDVLKVLQDNKETSLYVGKGQYRDGDGNLTTIQTGDFIGDTYPSVDDYGTRFPTSVTKENRNLYYWDGDKGEVVRSSPNGQIPISEYKMKSEFLRIKRDLDAALKENKTGRVISHFDGKNNEFVITFYIGENAETWAFREGENRWIAYYDYSDASGKAPDMYASVGNQVYAFLDNAWKFEANDTHNTFFGDYKQLSVRGVLNTYPRENKALKAIETDSNRGLKTIIETPVTNVHPVGQKSYLYEATYRVRDGRYTSAVFKNVLVAGGLEDITQIHSGDDMTGQYIEIEFEDAYSTECQLRIVTTSFSINR